jgi:flagellar basal-body rod modification protein FlgD
MTITSATTAATPAATPSTSASDTAALAGNFNDFLNLLMTQIQNQDPTSPMDTSQFTSQLVQYSSVEQQIDTNANLTTLINAQQSNTLLQSSSLIGKQVNVTSSSLSLQNGAAAVQFTAPQAETVDISVTSASGVKVLETTLAAQAGTNNWTWNGVDSQGNQLPDGAYQISVVDPTATALATTVSGTVTGLQRSGTTLDLSLGALTTDVNNVQSVATSN